MHIHGVGRRWLLTTLSASAILCPAGTLLAQTYWPPPPSYNHSRHQYWPRQHRARHSDTSPSVPATREPFLKVSATKPIHIPTDRHPFLLAPIPADIRMIFRITSLDGEVPIAVVGYGGLRADYILGWSGYSSNGSRCSLVRENLQGIEAISGSTIGLEDALRALQTRTNTTTIAKEGGATIVSVDFHCDQPISSNETFTAQLKFFGLKSRGWVSQDFTFEDRQIVLR